MYLKHRITGFTSRMFQRLCLYSICYFQMCVTLPCFPNMVIWVNVDIQVTCLYWSVHSHWWCSNNTIIIFFFTKKKAWCDSSAHIICNFCCETNSGCLQLIWLWELRFFSSQIFDEKPDFFPLLAAQTLGEEEDETAHHLEELKTMVKDMLDRFKAGVRIGTKLSHKERENATLNF